MDFPIAFETKDFIGLALLIPAFLAVTIALFLLPKLREATIFLIVIGPILPLGLDIHFYGADWYRGTIRGFEITYVDVLASGLLTCVLLDPREKKLYWPAGLAPLLVFSLWALITIVVMEPRIFGSYELSKMLRGFLLLLVAAFSIRTERRIFIAIAGLAAAVSLQSLWGLYQWFSGTFRITGTLEHANILSTYLCLITPVVAAAAASKHPPILLRAICWIAVIAAVPVILLTLSRTGMPVFAFVVSASIVTCISWRPNPVKVGFALLGLLLVSGLVARSWEQVSLRYGEATLAGEYFDEESEGRGYYFRQAKAILHNRPFGVGLNNWSYIVSKEFTTERGLRYANYDDLTAFRTRNEEIYSGAYAPPAHNLGLITLGEMGWVGLFLFVVAWFRWFHIALVNQFGKLQREFRFLSIGILFGLLGLFLQNLTEWTFRQSEVFMTFSLLLGILAALHQAHKQPLAPGEEDEPEEKETEERIGNA
ncbi:MAG: O-antigen ligase family protein [Opitutales bacterium]|nr:O-antigen ligase family protein [Opitutales bacterium]MCH8541400.1 O-antigen ligase family protein [Opitutales bacterium]